MRCTAYRLKSVLLEAADPDAGSGGFAEVQCAVGGAEGESFIVLAAGDGELGAGVEMQVVEEFQEFTIFFVDADDFGALVCLRSCVTPPLSGRPWGQDFLSAKRLRRSASISGEMACSRRSASSWALDQGMPMTSVSSISAS